MNISFNNGAPPAAPLPERNTGLSETQSSKLEYLLSNYDAASLTDTDAIDLVEKIRDIGIKSSHGLGKSLANAGFDARDIARKAGLDQQNPPPPPRLDDGQSGTINKEALTELNLFVKNFGGEDITANEWDTFFTRLDEQGIDLSKPFVDIKI